MATFTNQAQLSYNGIVTNSNIATGEIIEVLSVSKTAVSSTYNSGDDITYVVNIVNSGTGAFSNLTVSDNLGAYSYTPASGVPVTLYPLTYKDGSLKYFQNGALQTAPSVTVANGLTVTGVSVPAGGNTTLIYEASVNDVAPPAAGSTINNTVSVSGSEVTTPLQATSTVTAASQPYLTIFKSVSPQQVPENGQLTYTFEIQNLGNTATTAADNVQITDTFTPALSGITVTYNGAVLSPSDYSYTENTGVFSTNVGAINIPAATYSQDSTTGVWSTIPGTAVLTVTGNI